MTMATIQQQISLSEKRRQRAMALQPQVQTSAPQIYDETTTEGQVYSTRQQLSQARTPLQQFKSQYLFPKKRERAFTDRRARAQVVQAGQGVAEQLGQIQQQEQTFEREVATKAPEYALQPQRQQALDEAKQIIQQKVNDLNNRIQSKIDSINRYKEKERTRRDYDAGDIIDRLEDDISVYRAELREYEKGLGLGEDTLIKQYFSGYIKDKAQYEADYREARNRQQADFRKMKQDPKSDYSKIMDDLKKAGINIGTNPSLSQFEQGINKFNSDIAYKNQLLKFAEQKGGVQFLNPEQQKALGFDSQGFDYYKTPQKVWVDPRTGQVVEQSFINDNIPKNLGYKQYEASAFNKQTGSYLLENVKDSLLTDQQRRMYDLFQQNPKAAAFLGFNINQSAKLPTDFVLKGSTQPVEYQKPDYFNLLGKPSGSAYEAATRMQPFTTKESQIMEYKANPNEFLKRYGYGLTDEGQILYSGQASPLLITSGPGSWKSAFNVAGIAMLPRAAATFGIKKVGGYIFSEPIANVVSGTVSKIIPQQNTGFSLFGLPQQVARGALFYAAARNPVVGAAFIGSLTKTATTDPIGAVKMIATYARNNPYEIATGAVLSQAELRVRQVIARNKIYNDVNSKLIKEYGARSSEVLDFQKAWKRAFSELPKNAPVTKKFSVQELKVLTGDAKAVKLVNDILAKYSPEIIGTSVILPQTKLKTPPRGKFGDIDIQNVRGSLFSNKSKALAYEIYNKMKAQGYNIKIKEANFMGFKKYYLTLNGQEFINIGTSSKYFLETQQGPLRNLLEAEKFGQFTKDPLTGALIGNIRGQLRVKLAKGYVGADISVIRKLSNLYKAGDTKGVNALLATLKGREKDIVDALGIVKGTDYLIKEGKYIGPGQSLPSVSQVVRNIKEGAMSVVSNSIRNVNSYLTFSGARTTPGYGYYSGPRITNRGYVPPSQKYQKYSKPQYNPARYIAPSVYKPSVRQPIKSIYTKKPQYQRKVVTPYNPPLLPRLSAPYKTQPKTPYKTAPQPRYTRAPYTKPPYQPPRQNQTQQMVRNLIIRPKPEKKIQQERQPVRRPQRYNILPTITQQIYRVKRKGGRVKKPTGFELLRI